MDNKDKEKKITKEELENMYDNISKVILEQRKKDNTHEEKDER